MKPEGVKSPASGTVSASPGTVLGSGSLEENQKLRSKEAVVRRPKRKGVACEILTENRRCKEEKKLRREVENGGRNMRWIVEGDAVTPLADKLGSERPAKHVAGVRRAPGRADSVVRWSA
jgi:hypothetical protein